MDKMKYDTEILDNKICDDLRRECVRMWQSKGSVVVYRPPSSLRLSTVLASLRSDDVGSKLSAVTWLGDDD